MIAIGYGIAIVGVISYFYLTASPGQKDIFFFILLACFMINVVRSVIKIDALEKRVEGDGND